MKPSSRPPGKSSDSVYQQLAKYALVSAALTLMLWAVTAPVAQAQTFSVLYSFLGPPDGGVPYASVVEDKAHNLYGTTSWGGSHIHYGTVFEINSAGTETVLYSFADERIDGLDPEAPLLRDNAGALFGTSVGGGPADAGLVFKVDSAARETILHRFAGGTKDGCDPYGGLIEDISGNLYGTTYACGTFGHGTVFKLSKKGKETVLHSFAGAITDGAYPYYGNLLMDKRGTLYGVTWEGGSPKCNDGYYPGCGVVYKLSKSGKLTLLYSFTGETNGCYPVGTLAMDKAGTLYGVAGGCGSSQFGTVWKLSKKGTETILHNFAGGTTDGAYPSAGVVLDANGNLYGETFNGGAYNGGTVYRLSKGITLTLLHSFDPYSEDGLAPCGGVLRDAKGGLYGITSWLGNGGYGTVWSYK
jgi:uncharacterized repeat protein (TIGR03803 family)